MTMVEAELNGEIITDIFSEMDRQDSIFGGPGRDFPDYYQDATPAKRHLFYNLPSEWMAKFSCEERFRHDIGTWSDILVEEVVEAISSPNTEHLREELVQVCAVVFQWIKAIDKR